MIRSEYSDIEYDTVLKKQQRLSNWMDDNKDVKEKDANQDNPTHASFSLNKFAIYRPTFFSFIQHKYNMAMKGNQELLRVKIIKPQFFASLRSILDAKYNEFLQASDYRQISKFTDFTFSWLGNFQVDPITFKTVVNKDVIYNSFAADDIRFQFYIELHSPLLDQIWDVLTFREFLNEDSASDEIIFYLHCRHILFRGPQQEFSSFAFHPVHLVRWDYVERCILIIMKRYDQLNIDFICNQLKKRFITKQNGIEYFIDSALVLRTLLEYFRTEKQNRYKLIRDLFFNQPGKSIEGRYSISFDCFRKLFENNNFPNTTEIEKAYLYRQCYSIGRGIVSPEVFHTVLQDSNFFVKHLRFRLEKKIPQYVMEVQRFEPRFQIANVFDMICENLSQNEETSQNVQYLQNISASYGLEEKYKKVEDDVFRVKNHLLIKEEEINGKSLFLFLKQTLENLNGIVFQEVQSQSVLANMHEQEYKIIMDYTMTLAQTINEMVEFFRDKSKKREFYVQFRVKKFQKLARQKILKYYQTLNALLNTKQMAIKSPDLV